MAFCLPITTRKRTRLYRHCNQRPATNYVTYARADTPISTSDKVEPRRSTATQALSRLRSARILLSIRAPTAATAVWSANAAVAGGVRAISVSLRTPDALSVLRELRHTHPKLLLAAGGTLSARQQELARAAGAHLTLSPVADAVLVRTGRITGVPHLPGAATASEAYAMRAAGARIVKIFPARELGGTRFTAALARVLPAVHVLPTSGVALADLPTYLCQRTVVAVGVSSQILQADLVSERDAGAVCGLARLWVSAAASVRAGDAQRVGHASPAIGRAVPTPD